MGKSKVDRIVTTNIVEITDGSTGPHSHDEQGPDGYRFVSASFIANEDGAGDSWTKVTLAGHMPIRGFSGLYDSVRFRYYVTTSDYAFISTRVIWERVPGSLDQATAYGE